MRVLYRNGAEEWEKWWAPDLTEASFNRLLKGDPKSPSQWVEIKRDGQVKLVYARDELWAPADLDKYP